MNRDADRFVTGTELWLRWDDAHGVGYDDVGKSFDDVARDFCQSSYVHRELLTPELRGDGPSATHQAPANTACARALLIEAAINDGGGQLDLCVDAVHVRDPNGRIVPPQQRPEAMGEWGAAWLLCSLPPRNLRGTIWLGMDTGFRP